MLKQLASAALLTAFLLRRYTRDSTAPILMLISSPRNIPLLELEHGSASLRHADPLRPAPGCRNQPCAGSHARPERKPISASDSAGRYFRGPQLRPLVQRALEVSWIHSQALESQAQD